MATRTIGRLMPSRRPAQDATERFVIRPGDSLTNDLSAFQTLTPRRVREILMRAETGGEIADLYDVYERMERAFDMSVV